MSLAVQGQLERWVSKLHVFRSMGLRLQLLYVICEKMGLFRKKSFFVLE